MTSRAQIVSANIIVQGERDRRLSRPLAAYFVMQFINVVAKNVLGLSESFYTGLKVCHVVVIGFCLIQALPIVLARSRLLVILEIVWGILFLVSLLMGNAEKAVLADGAFWTLGICLPLAACVYVVDDKRMLYEVLLKASYAMAAVGFLVFLFPPTRSYDMTFSYALLIAALFHVTEWVNTRRPWMVILIIMESLIILLYGARGPLVCLATLVLVKVCASSMPFRTRLVIVFLGVTVVVLLTVFFDTLGPKTLEFLEERGFYSRTLRMLLDAQITYDSGRSVLRAYYADLISQKPVFGWGLAGGLIAAGSGPHNLLMSFLLAFGCFFGGAVCIVFTLLWFRQFSVGQGPLRDLLQIFSARMVTNFFTSGAFLSSPALFVFFALGFAGSESRKQPASRQGMLQSSG